jgi:hypothetical protein
MYSYCLHMGCGSLACFELVSHIASGLKVVKSYLMFPSFVKSLSHY